jgi:hypothetical protein
VALASRRSMGTEVSFGDRTLKCKDLAQYDFSGTDLCLMSAGGEVSKEWSPRIAAQGAVVIDNSSAWRYDQDVPLVVPEVNAEAVRGVSKKGIIANPNCSTAQLVVALKPLHDAATIKRVVVATYQSVSGAGKEGMDELDRQTKALYSLQEVQEKKFAKRIAFNVIPEIDVFMEDGFTKEEWKMTVETKKILDPKIKLTATCVRVPVFIGHSEAVNVEFERPLSGGRGPRHPALGAGGGGRGQARARRLRHAPRGGGRGRHLRVPHPRGHHGGERAVVLVRVGQPAERGGAERGSDRRGAGEPRAPGGTPAGGVRRPKACPPDLTRVAAEARRAEGLGRVLRSCPAPSPNPLASARSPRGPSS